MSRSFSTCATSTSLLQIMSFRTLSLDIFNFSFSANFSCANVGPNPLCLPFKIRASFFTSSLKRLLFFRPRFLEIKPAVSCFLYPFKSRFTCRVFKLKLEPLTRIPLRHRIPPNTIHKTLTRTSTLQSDFQRAEQNHGESKAKAQKSNGPPS